MAETTQRYTDAVLSEDDIYPARPRNHAWAREILKAGLTIEQIIPEAKDIAKQFDGITGMALTPERILGLIFSLAAESEALPNS